MTGTSIATLIILAAGLLASGQDAPPPPLPTPATPAPAGCSGATVRAVDGTTRCIAFESRLMIRISGSPDRWRTDAPRDWIRWPQAINDPAQWISESDAAVQHWLAMASPRSDRSLTAMMDIAADGSVAGCMIDPNDRSGAAVPEPYLGLCDTLRSAMRMRPAIGADGQPLASRFVVSIQFREGRVPTDSPREPLIAEPRLSPAPPPPPPAVPEWPPTRASRLPTAVSLALAPGGAAAFARDTPGWAGVWVTSGPDGPITCTVARPSGDARFDRRACEAASRRGAITYDWPANGRVYPVRTPVHFVPVDGRPHAIMPVTQWISGATIPATVMERVRALALAAGAAGSPAADLAALRLSISVDESGAVARCEVTQSSGNDAADAAVCMALRNSDGIVPGRDIFGWVTATRLYGVTLNTASP